MVAIYLAWLDERRLQLDLTMLTRSSVKLFGDQFQSKQFFLVPCSRQQSNSFHLAAFTDIPSVVIGAIYDDFAAG